MRYRRLIGVAMSCYWRIVADWMTWALAMECLGLVASVVLLAAVVGFLLMLRKDWILSRSALVALIPIAICAGNDDDTLQK